MQEGGERPGPRVRPESQEGLSTGGRNFQPQELQTQDELRRRRRGTPDPSQ